MPPQKLKGKDYSSDVILQSRYIKLERIHMIFGFLVNMENTSNIFLFHPLSPFPSKMMRCPWILCLDLLPTAVHRFDACYMSVPGLYISWHTQTKQPVILQHPGECWECWFQSDYTIVQKNTAMAICFTMSCNNKYCVHLSLKVCYWAKYKM